MLQVISRGLSNNDAMDSALVHIFVGYLLISWKIGLIQNSYCQNRFNYAKRVHLVNVCQNNNGSLGNTISDEMIILDAAGAPLQQKLKCKCYVLLEQRQQYIRTNILIDFDGQQNVQFEVNGGIYNESTNPTILNFTSESVILFRQEYQHQNFHACMGISKVLKRGSLTVRCEAYRNKHTLSTQREKESSTGVLTVILVLCTSIGVVVIIVVIACCVNKLKRRSANNVSTDSKSKGNRRGEQNERPAEVPPENATEPPGTGDIHEADSEYAYVDHCSVTARDKCNSTNPTESDVYNHLNDVKSGPHSDNVYSTTKVYNTTKQDSSVMSNYGQMNKSTESDVYNHLNEVRPSQHSDNIYNAANVLNTTKQDSGDTSSQYDSVELVKRKHHPQPESDYNELSFP